MFVDPVRKGWKPGAISKRLLVMLNKAKLRQSTILVPAPTKKVKKRIENKPMLIISKNSGEYRIEMRTSPEIPEGNEQYTPLIYKIAGADNESKIKKREKKQRQLIGNAIKEVWHDPYHPEVCEKSCFKAYREAIGLSPLDPSAANRISSGDEENNLNSCFYENNTISSCSSLDVDWEIQFSPPIAFAKTNHK